MSSLSQMSDGNTPEVTRATVASYTASLSSSGNIPVGASNTEDEFLKILLLTSSSVVLRF